MTITMKVTATLATMKKAMMISDDDNDVDVDNNNNDDDRVLICSFLFVCLRFFS